MFKKITCGLIAALALLFVFAACGSSPYNDKDLQDRLTQLEKDKAAMQAQLDELIQNNKNLTENIDQLKKDNEDFADILDGLTGSNGKIYQLGETFTYKSNGVALFSIKMEEYDSSTYQFTITNYQMPTNEPQRYVNGQFFITAGSLYLFGLQPKTNPGETKSHKVSKNYFSPAKHLFLGFPSTYTDETGSELEQIATIIPYAIFQIA